jgi:hypothetical protein
MKTVYYNTDTGKVTKWTESNSVPPEWNLSEGEAFLEVALSADPFDYYFDGKLVKRKVMNLTVEGNMISGIPEDTEVLVDTFGNIVVKGGTLELEANFDGPVYIELVHPHYKTKALTVTL